MDFSESTKVVYNRIQKVEPENVCKIIGYLLLQDHGDRDMIRLAFSPDNVIHCLINKAKAELLRLSKSAASSPISPSQLTTAASVGDLPLQFTPYSPTTIRAAKAYWDADQQPVHSLDYVPYSDSVAEMQFLALDDQLEYVNSDFPSNYLYQEPALGVRTSRRSPSLPDFPVKVCHYFNKGFCKHGTNCRYFHGHPVPESFSQSFSQSLNDVSSDDHVFSPGSLEKLELELTELLKSRRGFPVSIASLPMMYYEKYGKTLQAEGYLTESQRHGKAGFSLTKLLARLKNSIRLIDRPHGQHSVILADDVPKYLEYIGERSSDSCAMVAGSRQIYLTFPAESTFTEQDVSNYFNNFGPVQDVRIPCQQKRMFGFVTFVYAETVKQVLAKGNPHFVCGARVLVKPYREKSRLVDRKCTDKLLHSGLYGFNIMDGDPELHTMPRICDHSRLLKKQLMEEHEQVLEVERRRFSEMQLAASKPLTHHPYIGYSMEEMKLSEAREEHVDFSTAERFNYIRHINTGFNDPDSQGLDLPESPFATPIGSGISTAT